MFAELRDKWLVRMHQWKAVDRLQDHVAEQSRDALFTDAELDILRLDMQRCLLKLGFRAEAGVATGQPFHLSLLKGMLQAAGDVDVTLPDTLRVGVPTGVLEAIPESGVFAVKEDSSVTYEADEDWGEDSRACAANWSSAKKAYGSNSSTF